MQVRISAMTTLMQAGVVSGATLPNVAMGASAAGVICGDFNIGYVPGAAAGSDSANSYGVLAAAPNSFLPSIVKEIPGPPPSQSGMPSTNGGEAYDDVFYKLPAPTTVQTPTIFDPSTLWTAPNTFHGCQYASPQNALAAYWPRTVNRDGSKQTTPNVSDHMPAVLKVQF